MDNVKINNFNLDDDINIAKEIIDGKMNNEVYKFSDTSSIYKTTNECISHKPYVEALENKKRVLSIIGSGDQILNSILFGANDIVGIDISTFPKYFLSLKLAAIKTLKKMEYLEYFYGNSSRPFSDRIYELIRCELDDSTRIFWDSLYNEYNEKLYNSKLFGDFEIKADRATVNNPFLQDNFYDDMKKSIEKVNIELLKYDMFKVNELNLDNFDLILLSNIINNIYVFNKESIYLSQYKKMFLNMIKEYKEYLTTLPLNKKGIALTYNFTFDGEIKDYFKGKEYEVHKIKENTKFFDCENEILIYKKRRH